MGQTRKRERSVRRPSWKLIRYLLGGVCFFFAAAIFFEIGHVQVEGNVIYSDAEVLEASGIRVGQNGLWLPGLLAESRIRKALGNVAQVTTRLDVPDTVVIRVTETVACARLWAPTGPVLLSQDCSVVGSYPGSADELLQITGLAPLETRQGDLLAVAPEDETKLGYLQALLPLLAGEGLLEDTANLDITNASALTFRYQGRFTVRMGRHEGLEDKLHLLLQVLEDRSGGDTGVIDLSAPKEAHYIPA